MAAKQWRIEVGRRSLVVINAIQTYALQSLVSLGTSSWKDGFCRQNVRNKSINGQEVGHFSAELPRAPS